MCFCPSWEENWWGCSYQGIEESVEKSLNFGGKLSKVLRVHNSKQITEETNPDQWYFFLFVSKKELRFSLKWD